MGVYDRQIASAKRQIKAKGQLVVWRSFPPGTVADPLLPNRVTPAEPVNVDVRIAFFPLTAEKYKSLVLKPETEQPSGAVYGLMGQVPFVPNGKDVVIRDGMQYPIETIKTLAPNGEGVILYTIVFKAAVQL